MDTDTTNDSFLWSLTEIENDCSLCLRQVGIANNIPGVVLPCCQQVVCEDCYKDELISKNNGCCPFCFFKGNKGQKTSMAINNSGMSINGIINASNSSNVTSSCIPSTHNPNNNCLGSVGSGLPLDLSCWLPQNLTAICNPGYQSNSSSTCATSPYYKSNGTSTGDAFGQDNLIYMRGSSIPSVVCGVNSVNIGIGGPNINISSTQPSPFGTLADGFWIHSPNSTIISSTNNPNATSSSTGGSFISDPWMSTGGYSPSNVFLHDFGVYDNNVNNINNNLPCTNDNINTEGTTNVNIIRQYGSNNINNGILCSTLNNKIINNISTNLSDINGGINENDSSCDINDSSKDLYNASINMNSFASGASNINISNNASDIYHGNSIYTWTVQNPVTCNNINTFTQMNNHGNLISTTSVDVDFQKFCLGLGFDVNGSQHSIGESLNTKKVALNEHIHNSNLGDRSCRNVNTNHQDLRKLDKAENLRQKDGTASSENIVCEVYKSNSNIGDSVSETRDSQSNLILDNGQTNNDLGTNNSVNNITNNLSSNNHNHSNNNLSNSGNSCNSQLFNNSAFPPLASAIIKQVPSSKDNAKISSITSSNAASTPLMDYMNSVNSPNASSNSISNSNQNINNNNPSAGSNPKLIMMSGRADNTIRNNINISSALSTNNSKQNLSSSGKTGVVNNLSISTGNVSYVDAVLHKNDTSGVTTYSGTGRSENSTSVNSGDLSNTSNEGSNNLTTSNTDEDSAVALGAHGEPYNYKRALCRHWMRGYCWLEADCKFAHGEAELRTRDGKLRHPALTAATGNSESSSNSQTQYKSPSQISANGTAGSLTATSISSTFTSSSSGTTISSNIQSKNLKQQTGTDKNGGNQSYAATAASSLTNAVLNSDSNISYSVMVVSGASNLDSKR